MRSVALLLASVVLASCAAAPPPEAAPLGIDPIAPDASMPAPIWNVSGRILVRAFDPHRVLIAVDTASEGRTPDGIADHVMLATTTDDAAPSQPIDAEGTMELQGGIVRVTIPGAAQTLVLLYGPAVGASGETAQYVVAATLGLSDTTGNRLSMDDLARGGEPVACHDANATGCFRLASGRVIQFPL